MPYALVCNLPAGLLLHGAGVLIPLNLLAMQTSQAYGGCGRRRRPSERLSISTGPAPGLPPQRGSGVLEWMVGTAHTWEGLHCTALFSFAASPVFLTWGFLGTLVSSF